MNNRQRIIGELNKLREDNPSGDPHQKQMKALEIKNIEVLIELIETLEKIDTSNKKLEESNLKLSQRNLWLQVLVALLAAGALYVSLFVHRP